MAELYYQDKRVGELAAQVLTVEELDYFFKTGSILELKKSRMIFRNAEGISTHYELLGGIN